MGMGFRTASGMKATEMTRSTKLSKKLLLKDETTCDEPPFEKNEFKAVAKLGEDCLVEERARLRTVEEVVAARCCSVQEGVGEACKFVILNFFLCNLFFLTLIVKTGAGS